MAFPRFVVEKRPLAATPDERDRRHVEEALRAQSKKDVSATRVGDVTACADERGTAVVVAPRDGGAEVRVSVLTATAQIMALAAGFAAVAVMSVIASVLIAAKAWLFSSLAVAMGVAAALFLVSSRVGVWRAKRRAARVADAVVAALPRVRVEIDDEDEVEEQVSEPTSSKLERAAR